jgi:hypothetical protein
MAGLACTIVVAGELGDRFSESFSGLHLSIVDGNSMLSGSVVDRSELQGVLGRLFGLGLDVLSFTTDPPRS